MQDTNAILKKIVGKLKYSSKGHWTQIIRGYRESIVRSVNKIDKRHDDGTTDGAKEIEVAYTLVRFITFKLQDPNRVSLIKNLLLDFIAGNLMASPVFYGPLYDGHSAKDGNILFELNDAGFLTCDGQERRHTLQYFEDFDDQNQRAYITGSFITEIGNYKAVKQCFMETGECFCFHFHRGLDKTLVDGCIGICHHDLEGISVETQHENMQTFIAAFNKDQKANLQLVDDRTRHFENKLYLVKEYKNSTINNQYGAATTFDGLEPSGHCPGHPEDEYKLGRTVFESEGFAVVTFTIWESDWFYDDREKNLGRKLMDAFRNKYIVIKEFSPKNE